MARESTQHKLDRVSPPRVHITYDVEVGGAIESRELPLVIGVLGEFSGDKQRPKLRHPKFKEVNFDNFNAVMSELCPRARFSISSSRTGELELDLVFRDIGDFEPESLISRIDALAGLRQLADADAHAALARCLDRILHAPEFQVIESAWRGLWYLVSRTETSQQLKIKLLDVSKRELQSDLQKSAVDQSGLFKAVYEETFGVFGGAPFGLLIGNFTFDLGDSDLDLLDRLATIASRAHAPFVAAAGPGMFGVGDFQALTEFDDVTKVFDSAEYAKWRCFRESENAKYLALTLPRILLRSPYGARPSIYDDFKYQEDIDGGRHLLWGNASFVFGACVANAFTRYGWCGAIRGLEGGGLVEGLPTWIEGLPTWIAGKGESGSRRSCIELTISDRREKEISDTGFLPLVQIQGHADCAVFFTTTSCAKPRLYDSDVANANSRLSCQLQYILTASRFMHYLKVIVRDHIGSYVTRSELELMLNRWISRYICLDDQASPTIRTKLPLREARVEVLQDASQPGRYRVVMFLRPHFQLDELSVSLRLVGSVP
jgi:type VI secretion system protein ImpC